MADASNLVARLCDDALAWGMASMDGALETAGLETEAARVLNEQSTEIDRLRAALELSAEQTCEFGAGQPDDCGECYSCKAREALRGGVETSHD